jgi:hypothetical protein
VVVLVRFVVTIKSEQLNKDDLRLLLQSIRDCEQKHFKDKEIFVGAEAPDLTTEKMTEIVKSIDPPYNYGPVVFKYRGEESERD